MNLEIYEKVRSVPETALRKIEAGRLKGKSDINPVWRIKTLTETFGLVGFGWKYKIIEKRLEKGANDEISAFVDIELYVKWNGEWSEAVPGTGGSSFVAKEKNGLYQNDECFKMALTDALSVACKALGIGADVYWEADKTKYSAITENQIKMLWAKAKEVGQTTDSIHTWIMAKYNKKSIKELSKDEFDGLLQALQAKNKTA